ncbi:hypothetical protein NEICINOT_03702 [Neisseria cinerea ATCC 14685]|uniref:Uncharacterized protein n=1 Tax=Neisseria cinerea ATCC 14685 TaxID=546262 RepID=D0W224_NEICI|nr:hypothetical protein NEICINOT_03702 [Neisseria cinerea ATCC 14685]
MDVAQTRILMPSENLPLKRFYRRYTVKMFRCLFSCNCSRATGSKIPPLIRAIAAPKRRCPTAWVVSFLFSLWPNVLPIALET